MPMRSGLVICGVLLLGACSGGPGADYQGWELDFSSNDGAPVLEAMRGSKVRTTHFGNKTQIDGIAGDSGRVTVSVVTHLEGPETRSYPAEIFSVEWEDNELACVGGIDNTQVEFTHADPTRGVWEGTLACKPSQASADETFTVSFRGQFAQSM